MTTQQKFTAVLAQIKASIEQYSTDTTVSIEATENFEPEDHRRGFTLKAEGRIVDLDSVYEIDGVRVHVLNAKPSGDWYVALYARLDIVR